HWFFLLAFLIAPSRTSPASKQFFLMSFAFNSSKLPAAMPAVRCCYQKLRMRPAPLLASAKILPRRSLLRSRAPRRQLSLRAFPWWRGYVPADAFHIDQPDRYASPTTRSRPLERNVDRRVQRDPGAGRSWLQLRLRLHPHAQTRPRSW